MAPHGRMRPKDRYEVFQAEMRPLNSEGIWDMQRAMLAILATEKAQASELALVKHWLRRSAFGPLRCYQLELAERVQARAEAR